MKTGRGLSMAKTIITIARQFGSGGHEVAEKTAKLLGIPFYDKELIALAAKESGLSESLFDGIEEKPTASLLFSLVMGLQAGQTTQYHYGDFLNTDAIFRIQSQVIRSLADKGSCVIVGRCSDYVLREEPNLINVFVHADIDQRTQRIMELYHLKEKEALDVIIKNDKHRSSFYNFYANKVWGSVDNYHLSLNTSKITHDHAAELIVSYVKMAQEHAPCEN